MRIRLIFSSPCALKPLMNKSTIAHTLFCFLALTQKLPDMGPIPRWFVGMLSAFIHGGASAVVVSFGASVIAPDEFNTRGGLGHLARLAVLMFAWSGAMKVMAFLETKPTPWDGTTERRWDHKTPPPNGRERRNGD